MNVVVCTHIETNKESGEPHHDLDAWRGEGHFPMLWHQNHPEKHVAVLAPLHPVQGRPAALRP